MTKHHDAIFIGRCPGGASLAQRIKERLK